MFNKKNETKDFLKIGMVENTEAGRIELSHRLCSGDWPIYVVCSHFSILLKQIEEVIALKNMNCGCRFIA